jgi:hypothetical protein
MTENSNGVTMNPNTFARLMWQIPALVLLVVMMTPWLSVNSSYIGPWLIWLLALPVFLLAFGWRRVAASYPSYRAVSGAQVLTFRTANRSHPLEMAVHRHAA